MRGGASKLRSDTCTNRRDTYVDGAYGRREGGGEEGRTGKQTSYSTI